GKYSPRPGDTGAIGEVHVGFCSPALRAPRPAESPGRLPSDDPFDDETGKLSTKVQDAASRQLKDNDLSGEQSAALEAVMHWCETNRSRPDGAVYLRNRVIHAVSFTGSKGKQA